MHIARRPHLIIAAFAALHIADLSAAALAQDADIQTTYAVEKGACGTDVAAKVEITEGRITGPGFDCKLTTGQPAGTGLVTYEATCVVDGEATSEGLTLDLGNYKDHFKLSLPGRENWLALYPCTPVPGLK